MVLGNVPAYLSSLWFGSKAQDPEIVMYFLLPACMHAKLLQSCATLHNPMDCSPQGSSVHGILQARILEWVAISSPPGDLPYPGIELSSLMSPELASRFFITSATWKESWEV